MTALTHAQAHQHLHAAADGQLDAPGQAALAAHLATCAGCRAYAAELDALQISLAHLLHSRWDAPPIPSSLPARVRERASRTGRYRLSLHAAAKLAGVGLALALIALVAGWLNRQPLTPAPDSTLSIRVLGVHDVQAGETVRCIAAAYGISPAALIEANQLGQPPRLRSGSLLIPDAPAEVEAIGPTCAPQFAAPYALDPVAHVAAPPTFAFGLQDDAIEARASNAGCNWMIIAGQVYGRNGKPLAGLVVHLEGDNLIMEMATGNRPEHGPGGYAFQLDSRPTVRLDAYHIQLRNTNGQPLSEMTPVKASADCARNLAVVNFVQH